MFTPDDVTAPLSDHPVAVRILAGVWVASTVAAMAVYLAITVIGGHIDAPWPLYSAVPLGVLVAGAAWMTAPRRPQRPPERDELA